METMKASGSGLETVKRLGCAIWSGVDYEWVLHRFRTRGTDSAGSGKAQPTRATAVLWENKKIRNSERNGTRGNAMDGNEDLSE